MSSKVLILFSLFLLLLYGNCQETTTKSTIESVTLESSDDDFKDDVSSNQDGNQDRLFSYGKFLFYILYLFIKLLNEYRGYCERDGKDHPGIFGGNNTDA